ncbi:hypothetical protein [Methanocaldococcus sp.]
MLKNLVDKSWKLLEEEEFSNRLDDIFLGAITTLLVDKNFVLIDIKTDGNFKSLIFEDLNSYFRVKIGFYIKNHSLVEFKTIGSKVLITFSVGVPSKIDKFFKFSFKELLSSKLSNIGAITYDYSNYYTYVNITLYLLLNDYINENFGINWSKLEEDVLTVIKELSKYLEV